MTTATEPLPDKLPVKQSGVLFPAMRPPHPNTIGLWIRKGLRVPGGKIVKLAHLRIGGRVYVTREAAEAFIAALNPPPEPPPSVVSESAKSRARAAMAALEKLGV